jgi:hypothetical protein
MLTMRVSACIEVSLPFILAAAAVVRFATHLENGRHSFRIEELPNQDVRGECQPAAQIDEE